MVEKASRRDALIGAATGVLAGAMDHPDRESPATLGYTGREPAADHFRPGHQARQRRDHARGLRARDGAVRLSLGLAARQHGQSPRLVHPGARTGPARRHRAGRAARAHRHAGRLCLPGGDFRHLPEPGRGLRARLLRPRRRAGGDPGPRFRRPLLGLRLLRQPFGPVRPSRQALWDEARLLPARRAELAWRGSARNHRGRPQPDRTRQRHPAHLSQRHRRGPRRGSSAGRQGCRLSALRVRRTDEDGGLCGPAALSRAAVRGGRRGDEMGRSRKILRRVPGRARRRAAAAGRGGDLRQFPPAHERRARRSRDRQAPDGDGRRVGA